jgi:AmmeMemoRadiSam system protein A
VTGASGTDPAEAIRQRIGPEQARRLHALAWHAVESAVSGREADERAVAEASHEPVFGAFVTLRDGDQLRGCIGVIDEPGPAARLVARSARSSALHDPRFAAVEPHELPRLSIEVSLLSPLEPIPPSDLPEAIQVGRDGLVVESGYQRGLLLPQVATELGWSKTVFLEETCRKAGLLPNAWRQSASVHRFAAMIVRG